MLNINFIKGFTLIEVLVSMLVMSVGLIGVTGLQMTALDANRHAMLRLEKLANDITIRIDTKSPIPFGPVDLAAIPAVAQNCTVSDCTPAPIATCDTTQRLCYINSKDSEGT